MRQLIHARGIGAGGIVFLLREFAGEEMSPFVGFERSEDAVRRHVWA